MATIVTPVLKMQRAKEHLDSLEKAVTRFFSRNPSPIEAGPMMTENAESASWNLR